MPLSSRSIKTAFALHKQPNIRTAVANSDITYARTTQNFTPARRNPRARVSDYGFYGSGSNFASFNEVLHEDFVIEARQSPATDLEALFAFAYVMGGLDSAQGDALDQPNAWQHEITWADLGTSPEVDYTSFVEQMGNGSAPGWKKKLIGAWLSQVQITGTFGNFIQLAYQGGARRFATEGSFSFPALTAANLLYINRCSMRLAASSGNTLIDGKWVGFDLTFNQNPDVKLRGRQPAGQELAIERVDRGDQTVTGNIVIELESAYRDFFLNDTELMLEIHAEAKGELDATEANPAFMKIELPHFIVNAESFQEEGRTALLQLDLSNESILVKGGDEPTTVTIQTNINDSEILDDAA